MLTDHRQTQPGPALSRVAEGGSAACCGGLYRGTKALAVGAPDQGPAIVAKVRFI
jgi:hypothetical protein